MESFSCCNKITSQADTRTFLYVWVNPLQSGASSDRGQKKPRLPNKVFSEKGQ